jgi:Ni/Co efflux regulator RcnB
VSHRLTISMMLAGALALTAGSALAQQHEEQGGHSGGSERMAPAPHAAEPHAGPRGYQRPAEPQGWNARPAKVDRGTYQHNYQAARTYHVGPYHPPHGWSERRWGYGQILPRAFWAPEYFLSDYWLFGLEVPPAGYEWVRNGADALLVDTNTGEILQVEYGVFA